MMLPGDVVVVALHAEFGRLDELVHWGGLAPGQQTERGAALFPRIEAT